MIVTQPGTEVQVGLSKLTYTNKEGPIETHEIGALHDSTALWEAKDIDGLKTRLQADGYLFVRGLHDREEVLKAREVVLQKLRSAGALVGSEENLQGIPKSDDVLAEGCKVGCIPFMEGRNELTHSEAVSTILTGPRPVDFFTQLFGERPVTFDYKWLRAMHSEGFTGAHCDSVYMSRGTPNLLTLWTPFQDTDINMGTLAILEGSYKSPQYERIQATYGSMDVEAENLRGSGWFTEDPLELSRQFGGEWKTADFAAGDVLIFTMRTIHMSTTNSTRRARISCDTRWHAGSEASDPRYVGATVGHTDAKFGAHAVEVKDEPAKKFVTMEEKKKEWGFQDWAAATAN